jgi:hypothetical protein
MYAFVRLSVSIQAILTTLQTLAHLSNFRYLIARVKNAVSHVDYECFSFPYFVFP